MSYQEYRKNTRSIMKEPLVTIGSGKSGNIYLNAFAMKKYFNKIKYVILLYDEKKKRFAIKRLKKQKDRAYILGFSSLKSKSTGYVAARGFINLPFIKKYRGGHFSAKWNIKKQMLEVILEPIKTKKKGVGNE